MDLAQPRHVGAESGHGHHLVDARDLPTVERGQHQAPGLLVAAHGGGPEAGDGLDGARRGDGAGVLAQGATRLELVGVAAAEGVPDVAAPQQPGHPGAGLLGGEPAQRDQRVLRRRPGPGHHHVAAGQPGTDGGVVDVGDGVRDVVGVLALARGGVAVGAQRAGPAPGAGGVDDRGGAQHLVAARGLDVHRERHPLAVDGDQQVAALAGHPGHAVPGADLDAGGDEGLGQRAQVVLDPLGAGGRGRVGGPGPPGRLEQPDRGVVDELGPRREEPHVAPLADGRRRAGAGLEHDDGQPALVGVRGGGQPDGSGADDDERLGGGGGQGEVRHRSSVHRRRSI